MGTLLRCVETVGWGFLCLICPARFLKAYLKLYLLIRLIKYYLIRSTSIEDSVEPIKKTIYTTLWATNSSGKQSSQNPEI